MVDTNPNDTCPLCGETARSEKVDHGNRIAFWCRNDDCGPSELSTKALSHVRKTEDRQQAYRAAALSCRLRDSALEVTIDREGELVDRCVKIREL